MGYIWGYKLKNYKSNSKYYKAIDHKCGCHSDFWDLPDQIDYVVITHNHQDHLMLETLLQLRYKISNVIFPANLKGSLADPSIKEIMSRVGFSGLIELNEM